MARRGSAPGRQIVEHGLGIRAMSRGGTDGAAETGAPGKTWHDAFVERRPEASRFEMLAGDKIDRTGKRGGGNPGLQQRSAKLDARHARQ